MPFGDLFSSKGGGFNSSQAFFGRMSRVNVWNYVVSSGFIQEEMSTGCGSWNGNAVAWFYFKDNINGNIEIIRPSSCSLVGKCVQSHPGVYTRGNQLHRCCNVKALAESNSKPQWIQRSVPINRDFTSRYGEAQLRRYEVKITTSVVTTPVAIRLFSDRNLVLRYGKCQLILT